MKKTLRPGILAVRAVNQYRRREVFAYLVSVQRNLEQDNASELMRFAKSGRFRDDEKL